MSFMCWVLGPSPALWWWSMVNLPTSRPDVIPLISPGACTPFCSLNQC